MQPSGTYWLQNDDYIFLKWLMSFCFVCVCFLVNSQRLHHVSVLHSEREGLPESSVSLSGCSFLPLFTRAGFQVSCDHRCTVLHAKTLRQFWILLWFFVVIHIAVTLNQQQHVWFCVTSFPGRRAGGWRTKTPQIPTLLWCLKASCSMKWRVLL